MLATLPFTYGTADAQATPDSTRIREMEEQFEAITREIERLSLGREVVVADTGILGFGPGASKVYKVEQGLSIGGYGEFLYENFAADRENGDPSGKSDQVDALRAIFYVGYKFNDRILFNSEVEFEHGSTSQSGSASLEEGSAAGPEGTDEGAHSSFDHEGYRPRARVVRDARDRGRAERS